MVLGAGATDSDRHTSTSYTLIEKEPYFQVGCWFSSYLHILLRKSQCTKSNVQIDRYSRTCIGSTYNNGRLSSAVIADDDALLKTLKVAVCWLGQCHVPSSCVLFRNE